MRFIFIVCFAIFLSACGSNFRQAKPDSSGYLPIGDDADVRIMVNQAVDTSQFKKVLYVSMDMHGVIDWYGYQDYVMEGFRQLDFFDEVITRQPTIYMNVTPLQATKTYDDKKQWVDMVDPVSNTQILKQYGPNVMIAKALIRNKSDDYGELGGFYFQLQLIDPSTSKVVFQGSKTGSKTLGVDLGLINPVLNYAKGYLLNYDPYYVPNREAPTGLADYIQGQEPTTPFSYEQGRGG